jgi:hypothetical protein
LTIFDCLLGICRWSHYYGLSQLCFHGSISWLLSGSVRWHFLGITIVSNLHVHRLWVSNSLVGLENLFMCHLCSDWKWIFVCVRCWHVYAIVMRSTNYALWASPFRCIGLELHNYLHHSFEFDCSWESSLNFAMRATERKLCFTAGILSPNDNAELKLVFFFFSHLHLVLWPCYCLLHWQCI